MAGVVRRHGDVVVRRHSALLGGMVVAIVACTACSTCYKFARAAFALVPSAFCSIGNIAAGQSGGFRAACRRRLTARQSSILDMLEEAVGVPTPQAASASVPSVPLDSALMKGELVAYMLEEKGMSMSGEDFEVKSPEGEVILKIGGGNRVPIPGVVWDKLSISTPSGAQIATLDRQPMSLTTTYDVLRGDGSKFGRISKAMFALTQTFELWEEGNGQPLLRAEGSFSEKKYVFKCREGAVVATVARLPGFSQGNVDNYQVVVGPNVDATLVLAMAVIIDEVHDEDNKDAEGTGESLPEQLADIATNLPMPKAAFPAIPSGFAGAQPWDPPLVHDVTTAYELEEKALSMSGEDFEVKSPIGQVVLRVGGGNRIPIQGLPVWDKLTVSTGAGSTIGFLDREMVALTPTYDVLRADGSKLGKIDKAMFGLSETFELYLEGDSGGPVLKAEGSFGERRYSFKNRDGVVVATVGKGYFQNDNENRYHVVVGPQVDASLVVAMAVVIDEVHDEQAAREGGEGGGFPFR